jgi:hypothetical protein
VREKWVKKNVRATRTRQDSDKQIMGAEVKNTKELWLGSLTLTVALRLAAAGAEGRQLREVVLRVGQKLHRVACLVGVVNHVVVLAIALGLGRRTRHLNMAGIEALELAKHIVLGAINRHCAKTRVSLCVKQDDSAIQANVLFH